MKSLCQYSETNWLNYFQILHPNNPLTSDQQKVVSELQKRKDTLMQSRPLDYPITLSWNTLSCKKIKERQKRLFGQDKKRND